MPPPSTRASDPGPPDAGPPDAPVVSSRRRSGLWRYLVGWLFVLLVGFAIFANIYRVDYYTIAPGDALNVPDKITVADHRAYPPSGRLMLLFVRERGHITLARYLQAWLDDDIDLVKSEQIAGDQSPAELRAAAVADMASSQAFAKVVALRRIGEDVTIDPGVRVISTVPGRPADGLFEQDDVITEVDGEAMRRPDDLGEVIAKHRAGDRLTVRYERDGKTRTTTVRLAEGLVDTDGDGVRETPKAQLGVYTLVNYRFPFEIGIDTSDIGGPSAGLAMALAVADELTPGDLTGGASVAVTGTIDPEGGVGQVGGVAQKAVAARTRGATLLLVPSCAIDDDSAAARAAERACESEVSEARSRAGKDVEVVEVDTFEDALDALAAHGGDPLPPAPAA